jgi:hypothetical protein
MYHLPRSIRILTSSGPITHGLPQMVLPRDRYVIDSYHRVGFLGIEMHQWGGRNVFEAPQALILIVL